MDLGQVRGKKYFPETSTGKVFGKNSSFFHEIAQYGKGLLCNF